MEKTFGRKKNGSRKKKIHRPFFFRPNFFSIFEGTPFWKNIFNNQPTQPCHPSSLSLHVPQPRERARQHPQGHPQGHTPGHTPGPSGILRGLVRKRPREPLPLLLRTPPNCKERSRSPTHGSGARMGDTLGPVDSPTGRRALLAEASCCSCSCFFFCACACLCLCFSASALGL